MRVFGSVEDSLAGYISLFFKEEKGRISVFKETKTDVTEEKKTESKKTGASE